MSNTKIIDSPGKQQTQEERFERVRTLIHAVSAEAAGALAREAAELIRAGEAEGRKVVLGLATGSTPVPVYRELIRLHEEEGLSFRNVVTFNLDEYYGLGRDHGESYYRFMKDQLFAHVDIPEEQVHIPDGTTPTDEVYEACLEYERKIEEAGGIDLQILGIGRTGHIGFNEPGSSRDSITRMITLDRVTRQDAAADFLGEENVPRFAITMGVGTILKARRIVLMAWGENKAEVVRAAVEEEVTDAVSASYLQEHANATILVDRAAGSQLTRSRLPWLVRSVEWDEATTKRAVTWLAKKLSKPVLKLVDEEYNENGMAELLTVAGPAYNLNIAVFNQLQRTITGWPGGKPKADDSNRPERALPHPKRVVVFSPEPEDAVVAMGGTLQRLVEQGHEVWVVHQTSGNLRVSDVEASKFARVALEMAEKGEGNWEAPRKHAQELLRQLDEKSEFEVDVPMVRQLKGLILRGEAQGASEACGVAGDKAVFLDLPFYELGRYRRFKLSQEDIDRTEQLLQAHRPHQIYLTGNVADPSSLQAICFAAVEEALSRQRAEDWMRDCRVWVYHGRERRMEPHEIDMAVPMSPDQAMHKRDSISRFQTISREEARAVDTNRAAAASYDELGMAEYEAIEAFESWLPDDIQGTTGNPAKDGQQ